MLVLWTMSAMGQTGKEPLFGKKLATYTVASKNLA